MFSVGLAICVTVKETLPIMTYPALLDDIHLEPQTTPEFFTQKTGFPGEFSSSRLVNGLYTMIVGGESDGALVNHLVQADDAQGKNLERRLHPSAATKAGPGHGPAL